MKEIKVQNYLVFFIFQRVNVAVLNITLKYCLNLSFNFNFPEYLTSGSNLQDIAEHSEKKKRKSVKASSSARMGLSRTLL